jgi:hypothetical protein
MTKVIVYTKSDGSVTVRVPCPHDQKADEAEDDFLARVMAVPVRSGVAVSAHILERSDVPTDREYRNAWTYRGGKFDHDMSKAKEAHRDKIREARKPLLDAQDLEVSKALANGDSVKVAAAEAERQRLRDATADPRINAAKTVAELKAAWPL